MAVSNYRALQAFVAAADLSDAYGKAVKIGPTVNNSVVISTTGAGTIGVVVEPAPEDGVVGVCCEQGVKVPARVSGPVPLGSFVTVDTDGRFKVATSGQLAIGICEEAATAADQIVSIVYTPAGVMA